MVLFVQNILLKANLKKFIKWESSGTGFQTLMKKASHMLNMMLLMYLVIQVQFNVCINNSLFKVNSALDNWEICLGPLWR